MNAECATDPKTFVFKNEICRVTFKWFPLGFDRNFGKGPGLQTYPSPASCALTTTPVAQSDSGSTCCPRETRSHSAHAGAGETEQEY